MDAAAAALDMADRQPAESELRRSRDMFEKLYEHSPDAIIVVNGDGRIERVNTSAETLFGRTRKAVLGQSIEFLMPERFRGRHLAHRSGYMADPRMRTMGANLELLAQRDDGTEFPVDIMLSPIELDGTALVLAVVRDVSERKHAEEAQTRLAAIVASSEDAILSKTLEGIVTTWNAGAERLFGYPAHEMIGQSILRLVPPELIDLERSILARIRQGERVEPFETMRLAKDGSRIEVSLSVSPLRDRSGRAVGASTVARDVSERRLAEKQAQEAARRATLLREVHHRVKNNLQVVSSMLSLQGDAVRDKAALTALAESQHRIASIALVHEELYRSGELGRIDFGDYVQVLCTNLLRAHGPAADRIALDFLIDSIRFGLDTAVPCGLIVNELVSNALKHAFPSEHPGRIRIRLRAEPDGWHALEVEDDGVGLPSNFDPTARPTLGLQLIHLLTGQLEGRVEQPLQERGACFRILFREVLYKERV